ncbi:MAG: DUF4838 domain-containing protein [Candidatus Hydrogenedentes bacterium]|nr:DUF4838 domain-containing protein [Candidatus Hydrogenedentota bacterium]
MMRTPKSFLIACTVAVVLAHTARAELILVDGSKPLATIVIDSGASEQTRHAAEELQAYIERISGARLDIRSGQESISGPAILVGPSQAVRDLGVEVPSGFTSNMNEEGYVIRTIDSTLILAGNEDGPYRGTLFAVYDFLESLGSRWYFPGPYGEVIPKRETIAIPNVNRTEHPDFRFRNIWYSGWMPVREEDSKNLAAWLNRNRMTSLSNLSLPGDGTITRLAPAEQHFESHPQIYALNEKGERMKDMLCLSEPEAIRIAVKTITDEFRAHPESMTFGFAPPDGHPRCYCDKCKASIPGFSGKGYGEPSLSDQWFRFANAVAKEVYKEFPDRWLLTNGYANRVLPPEGVGPLSPNLGIQSALLDACTLHPIGDERCWQRQVYKGILDRWTRELNCVFIYDYDPGKSLDGLPFPMLHNLMRDFPYFKQRNLWGFWTEGQNCWMVTHLNYYIRGRLMWDADADVRALVRDYCESFYGPAGHSVEEYIWTLEDAIDTTPVHETWGRLVSWQAVLTPDVVRRLNAALARAKAQVHHEPDQTHVRVLELVHENMTAFLNMEDAAGRGDFAGAVSCADRMLAIREEVGKIDSALLPFTPEWCRDTHGSPEWYKKTYQGLADQAGGSRGELVALLPARWEFKTDPEDLGTIYQWYNPDSGQPWDEINCTLYWDLQGYQDARGWAYAGKAWYRADVFVPKATQDKPVRLTFGGVYSDKLWIWINGMLVEHRERQGSRDPFDLDVTAYLRPGERNCIAVLIDTIPADRSPRGGLYRRAFLWSPKP